MDDKDQNISFGDTELFLCGPGGEMKPLGRVVEHNTDFEAEDEPMLFPVKGDFSITADMPSLSDWFKKNIELWPVRIAQNMLDRLGDYQALWHKYYGAGMRKERRELERRFNALAQRLAIHCGNYGIMIKKHDDQVD